MTVLERAKELRACTEKHYNCCQAVAIPFAEKLGLDAAVVEDLAAQFGGGMRRGLTCGALCGGIMALGLWGKDDQAAAQLHRRFLEKTGAFNCFELLAAAKARGEEKKSHCDGLVYTVVELVEELLSD